MPEAGGFGGGGVRPEVVSGVLRQHLCEGAVFGIGGDVAGVECLPVCVCFLPAGFQAACLGLALPAAFCGGVALLLQGVGGMAGLGEGVGIGGGKGGEFLLQLLPALGVGGEGLLCVCLLLLFEGEFAFQAACAVLPAVQVVQGFGFGGFLFGQAGFVFGNDLGDLGELFVLGLGLGVQGFVFCQGFGALLLQLGKLGLGGLAVAFAALPLGLVCAYLFFQPCGLFAGLGVPLAGGGQCLLVLLFALAQGLHLCGGFFGGGLVLLLPCLRCLMLCLGLVCLGKGVLPLGEVGEVLVLCEFGVQAAVAFGGFGLPAEFFGLAGKLGLQVGKAGEVFAGIGKAGGGFAAAFFVFGNACGFFYIHAQFFGAGFDDA